MVKFLYFLFSYKYDIVHIFIRLEDIVGAEALQDPQNDDNNEENTSTTATTTTTTNTNDNNINPDNIDDNLKNMFEINQKLSSDSIENDVGSSDVRIVNNIGI